jgi:hypothetical protein
MRFAIKEPVTGEQLMLDAEPEDYNGEQALRIIFPERDSFLLLEKDGEWQVLDEEDLNPLLVEAVVKGLHSYSRFTTNTDI